MPSVGFANVPSTAVTAVARRLREAFDGTLGVGGAWEAVAREAIALGAKPPMEELTCLGGPLDGKTTPIRVGESETQIPHFADTSRTVYAYSPTGRPQYHLYRVKELAVPAAGLSSWRVLVYEGIR